MDVRTAEIQNQCTILCNSLGNSNYLADGTSEILQEELIQLSNIYSGRVKEIDNEIPITLSVAIPLCR